MICGQIQINRVRQKYRICECDNGAKFCEVTLFLQDDVSIKTCDLQDSSEVFGADLYYHRVCLLAYAKWK